MKRGQPQSWNRYAHCLNNPLFYVDPTGLVWAYVDSNNGRTRTFKWYDRVRDIEKGYTLYDSHYASLGDGPTASIYLGDGPKDWHYISKEEADRGTVHEIAAEINEYFRSFAERANRAEEDGYLNSWLGSILLSSAPSHSGAMHDPMLDERDAEEEQEEATIRLRHYTSVSGRRGIEGDGVIRASDQNAVFAVRARGRSLSPIDVEATYGIGRGRGSAYVEFDARPFEFEIIPRHKFTEFKIRGDVNLTDRSPTFHLNR